ncbi:TonB-dependent siderophore receptor [Pleionea sp. CnH1-48]|uniref:TonB-dependent receptor plug domain-containing protein n=1 Tax=Pleionea sp. CnH1-48 TaxID=2954494 RepID=UPI002097E6C8|nr:TonB-dependent receptor plug domain-containing protein [Pleionea sp. CnH1-48]MCO7223652.1 TonB-dependent receptor plug domain-containing protein [Pleionea sp. CnH1-48]
MRLDTHILAQLTITCLLIFLALSSGSVVADDDRDLFNLELSELMNLEITVSSNKEKTIRKQPSIVSVMTKEQIQQSSARNLLDILKHFPGFWVGVDAQGVFSLSFRGVWGIDGKILLIIDGIEQNDLAFGTIILNNRYSAQSIERVEVIRGPGSVLYGGDAELAVINVTTYDASQNGGAIFVSSDFTSGNTHNKNLTFMVGNQLDNGIGYSLSGFWGAGDYSNKDYVGIAGNSFSLKNNSNVTPMNLNFSLSYDTFDFRVFYDDYEYEDRIGIGGIGLFSNDFFNPSNDFTEFTRNGEVIFKSLGVSLKHQESLTNNFNIKTHISYIKQEPWGSFYPDRGPHRTEEKVSRRRLEVIGLYDLNPTSNILFGLSHYKDKMTLLDSYFLDPTTFFNGSPSDSVSDNALFVQYESSLDWADITLGARYENNGFVGSSVVPRLSITKANEDHHIKFVYSEAFKIPKFGTLATAELVGTPIAGAEELSSIEFEYGTYLSDDIYIQGNIFHLDIEDYIAYEPNLFANITAGQVKTLGAELLLKVENSWGITDINYSYFELNSQALNGFAVVGKPQKVLGIPNHMLKFSSTINLSHNNLINITGAFIGHRYACIEDTVNFVCGEPEKLSVESNINIFYQHQIENVNVGIGIANIFDTDVYYVQPYRGGQAPTPGLERRLMLDLSYKF